MILEIAFMEVLPDSHLKFEAAVKKAVSEILSKSKGFIDFEMHKGIERANTYTLLIHWQTLEDHTVGFRQSDAFIQWRAAFGEHLASPPQVDHWSGVKDN
jgi:heme-degrading monooxygenase HmoA